MGQDEKFPVIAPCHTSCCAKFQVTVYFEALPSCCLSQLGCAGPLEPHQRPVAKAGGQQGQGYLPQDDQARKKLLSEMMMGLVRL